MHYSGAAVLLDPGSKPRDRCGVGVRGCREVTSCGRVRSSLPGRYPGGVVWLSALGHAVQDTQAVADTRTIPDTQTIVHDEFRRFAVGLGLVTTSVDDPDTVRAMVRLELDERAYPRFGSSTTCQAGSALLHLAHGAAVRPMPSNWSRRETRAWIGCQKSSSKVSNRTKPSCCLPRVAFGAGGNH